jgi:hypothetical protein
MTTEWARRVLDDRTGIQLNANSITLEPAKKSIVERRRRGLFHVVFDRKLLSPPTHDKDFGGKTNPLIGTIGSERFDDLTS